VKPENTDLRDQARYHSNGKEQVHRGNVAEGGKYYIDHC
jgi:hypothetical protein